MRAQVVPQRRRRASAAFGGHGRNSAVGRIYDQRRPPGVDDLGAAVKPGAVVSRRARRPGRASPSSTFDIVLLEAFLFVSAASFLGEKLLAGELGGPLQGVRVALVQIPCKSGWPSAVRAGVHARRPWAEVHAAASPAHSDCESIDSSCSLLLLLSGSCDIDRRAALRRIPRT